MPLRILSKIALRGATGKAAWMLLALSLLWSQAATASHSTTFPRPPELEPEIRFWTRVYTEIDTRHGFIHDSRHLDVVYETVRLPPRLSKQSKSRKVKRIKERYRKILLRLASGKRRNLSAEEQRVLSLWPDAVSDRELRDAARRLRFQLGQADKFRAGLIRAGAWEPFIRETFARLELPEELAALPHVESSYDPRAHSHVGAAGLWQFTRPTGRRYMRVDHVADERLDPYEATVAAARLLKHNLEVTGSWPLAITAYNHGASGMRRAARKLGTRDITVIVRRYKSRSFGFASRNFYVAFLAALDVSQHADDYFGPLERNKPSDTEVVEVPDYMTVGTLAAAFKVDEATLKAHNPALRSSVWTGAKYVPRGYRLRLPRDDSRGFTEVLLAAVPPAERFDAQKPDAFHRVRRGDTLSSIAARYDTSVRELQALNTLRSRHHIRTGQVLRLPVRETAPVVLVQAPENQPAELPEDGTYTVTRGDTLAEIAQRFGIDEQVLVASNGLPNRNRIYAGQTLRLNAPKPTEANGSAPQVDSPSMSGIDSPVLQAVALVTDTIPVSQPEASPPPDDADESDSLDGSIAEPVQPELTADPSDYTVSDDDSVEVQAAETLGHYAEWLGLRASQLRRINRMSYGQPVVIGRRLRLDFSQVKPQDFEKSRLAYHQELQAAFFERYQIAGTCRHVIRPGDSLWTISHGTYDIPVWLLRQYNPDSDFSAIVPGKTVAVPILQPRDEQSAGQRAGVVTPSRAC